VFPRSFRFSTLFNICTYNGGRTCDFCIIPYQRRLNAMPFVPPTTYGRATPGAIGVANDLFLAYKFCDTNVGIHIMKDLGLLRSSMVCCNCGSQLSWCVDTNCKDGLRCTCRRITSASTSGMVQRFSTVITISLMLCSSRTSSQAHLPSLRVLPPRDSPSPHS
jgi:hypothetical protein